MRVLPCVQFPEGPNTDPEYPGRPGLRQVTDRARTVSDSPDELRVFFFGPNGRALPSSITNGTTEAGRNS
jgi:hypothetical protein